MLTLDMCLFIREHVKQYMGLGTVCDMIQHYFDVELKQQTVLNVYMHEATLSAQSYDFICVICCFLTPVLNADLNGKVVFKCHTTQEYISYSDGDIAY